MKMTRASVEQKSSANDVQETVPADFETAIRAAGFGKFNIFLLFVALFGVMGTVFETSAMSYVLPSAECDLRLTLMHKGLLNAITYVGMISSAIIWGFLADTKGRKTTLVVCLLLGGVCDFCYSTSQSVVQLMILKYFGGFIMCGPYATIMSYLSETHGKRFRSLVLMITGFMVATSTVLLPLLALTVLPRSFNLELGTLRFRSWQLFLAVSSLPSLLSGFFFIFFPESPKFLMSQGRNVEALEAFKFIYSINKNKPKHTFPIKELVCEAPNKDETDVKNNSELFNSGENLDAKAKEHSSSFKDGLHQLKPLFRKPYLRLSAQVYLINVFILLGQNTFRLWLPQLFASTNEYEKISGNAPSMCDIVEFSVNRTATIIAERETNTTCEVVITTQTLMNNLIVGCTNLVGYVIVSIVVNWVGTKQILLLSSFVAGTCGISLIWSTSANMTLIIAALFTTCGSISCTSIISSSINAFPTALRTMIVSLGMMFGRGGSMIGNVIFPVFMSFGCFPPFLLVSSVMYLGFLLSMFLPNLKKTALK